MKDLPLLKDAYNMKPITILFNRIRERCQSIHKHRLESLLDVTQSLIDGKKLSLNALGRSLKSKAKTKHCIKKVDRLLGNKNLNMDRMIIYENIAKLIIKQEKRPLIIVDWSPVGQYGNFYMISAAIPLGGRGMTIYAETHSQKDYDTFKTNTEFLNNLKKILPCECSPVIITDAGFRNPWFKAIQALNWDFVGRSRGKTLLRPVGSDTWISIKDIYQEATHEERFIGAVELAKNNILLCNIFLYKKEKKNRIRKTLTGKRVKDSSSLKYAQRERDPWLLGSSIPLSEYLEKKVVKIYKTRMQIEESYRDIKNSRFGFSMSEARAKSAHRFDVLLLIGFLAYVAMYLIGKIAQSMGKQYDFQSNTTKIRPVLSVFFLGCEVYRKKCILYEEFDLENFQELLVPIVV